MVLARLLGLEELRLFGLRAFRVCPLDPYSMCFMASSSSSSPLIA